MAVTDTGLVTGTALVFLVSSLALWLRAGRQWVRRRAPGAGIAGGSFTLWVGLLLLALTSGDPAYYPLLGLSFSLVVLGVHYALAGAREPRSTVTYTTPPRPAIATEERPPAPVCRVVLRKP